MNCEQIKPELDDYLDGRLDSTSRQSFEAHIAQCAVCRHRFEQARDLQRALASYPIESASDDFFQRALANAPRASTRRLRQPPRLIAAGFVVAFAASILTLIYTGLLVRSPSLESGAGLSTISMTIDESRTVNLVFASNSDVDDVSLLVDLPMGVELLGYAGQTQVRWRTRLQAGKNVLPLQLVAFSGMGGQLTARLQHGDKEKVFMVDVSVI